MKYYRLILNITFLLFFLFGSCSKQKNTDRKIYGTIVSKTTNQPIANKEFLLATDKQKGVIFNKGYTDLQTYPFATNDNGNFEVVFRSENGNRIYIALGSIIQTGGDPYDGAIWVDKNLSKSETNINVGTITY